MSIKHVLDCQYVKDGKVLDSEGLDLVLVEVDGNSPLMYLTQGNGGSEFVLTRDQAASLQRKLNHFINYLDLKDL